MFTLMYIKQHKPILLLKIIIVQIPLGPLLSYAFNYWISSWKAMFLAAILSLFSLVSLAINSYVSKLHFIMDDFLSTRSASNLRVICDLHSFIFNKSLCKPFQAILYIILGFIIYSFRLLSCFPCQYIRRNSCLGPWC